MQDALLLPLGRLSLARNLAEATKHHALGPLRCRGSCAPLLPCHDAPPPGVLAKKPLTIERITASPPISGAAPRLLKLSPDGRYASLLKPREPTIRERFDLWAMDTNNGQLRMLIDSTKIGGGEISEAEKMRRERARVGGSKGIVEYEWAPDGKSVLLAPVDGDLYLADVATGTIRRLTNTPQTEIDAHVSEGVATSASLRDQNLYRDRSRSRAPSAS